MTNSLPSTKGLVEAGRIPGWVFAPALSLLVSLAILLPFFWFGTASGHDFEFHVASWLDIAYQWKEGTFYPRWTAWTNHGFGEPRFIFYPPLSLMFGAALTRLAPISWVPALFILLMQTFAGLSAFLLLRRLVSERAAILAAACYAGNPDALLITYNRSDFAEQLACAIFPLLLLGALKISEPVEDSSHWLPRIVLFAIPFAGVWLSNAPTAVIGTYTMALLFAWAAVSQRSWRVAVRGACGLALGFGLASFYLVPAAYEQRWVNIAQALSSGLLPGQNFLFTATGDPEHTWFNWIASICGLLLILLFLGAALASRRFTKRQTVASAEHKVWNALLVLGTVASLLTLRITSALWNHLPKLRFVQFPWRWMSIVAMIFTCFLASVIERRRGWIGLVVFVVLSVPLAHFLVSNSWWDADEMATEQAAITGGTGLDGTDEYDPLGDDHLDLPATAPVVSVLSAEPDNAGPAPQARAQVEQWRTEQRQLYVQTNVPSRVALRVLNYPAWRVEVNGKWILPERLDDTGQMVIPVERGTSEIHIWFGRTMDRTVGIALSVFSLVLAGILGVIQMKWRRKQQFTRFEGQGN